MPIYEYECSAHGRFEQLTMSRERAREPAPCPRCGCASSRVVSAPELRRVSTTLRSAREREERSRVEPAVHRPSCGHDHGATAGERSRPRRYTGARPWVIEHG